MADGDGIGGLVPAPSSSEEWAAWSAQRETAMAPITAQRAALTAEMTRLENASMLPGADGDALYRQYQLAENQRSILEINNNTTFPPHISDSGQFEPGDFQSYLNEKVGGQAAWDAMTPEQQRTTILMLGPEYQNMRTQEAARRGASQRLGPVMGELFAMMAGGPFGRCRTCGPRATTARASPAAPHETYGARVPVPAAGTPERAELSQNIRNVNAGPITTPGTRTQNCANCAVATDATLAGTPASALPGGVTSPRALEAHYGRPFSRPVDSIDPITNHMIGAGDGARGLVGGNRGPGEVGHVFNVVNNRGQIHYIDGQTGGPANLGGYQTFRLMRTD